MKKSFVSSTKRLYKFWGDEDHNQTSSFVRSFTYSNDWAYTMNSVVLEFSTVSMSRYDQHIEFDMLSIVIEW